MPHRNVQNEVKGLLFEALSIIRDQRMTFLQVQHALHQDDTSKLGVEVRKINFEPGWHKLSDQTLTNGEGTINVLEVEDNRLVIYEKVSKGSIFREWYMRDAMETITMCYGKLWEKKSGKVIAASESLTILPFQLHQFEVLEDASFIVTVDFTEPQV